MDYYLQNYFIYKNIPYLCTKEKIFQKYAHKMIKDFNFFAPTRIVFGKNAEMQIGDLVAQQNGHKVLVHYGGGSAERSGLLDVVREQLKSHGIPFVELGGVVPNPLLSKVQEGISLCRREQVDFILAVGGGSVIDSAKAIGYGSLYDGDVWDFWAGKAVPEACLPIGVVLTIPAAGSEMSSSCVITKDDGLIKRGINSDLCRCRFAVMNPERTYTLPPYQTAAGATDIMMHTMERYFSKYEDMTLTDAIAEALLRTVKDAAVVVMEHPEDYRNRAQIMWAGSLAHELSALFGVTHGAGLAALWPSWARYVKDKHLSRFVQFAVNVMGVENDFAHPDETAEKGICAIEDFYRKIGMPTNIHELLGREITDDEIEVLVDKCSRGNTITIGAFEVLGADEMRAIYRLAK